MNERIFKLALKAMDFHGAVDIDTDLKMSNSELEKFAHLIVEDHAKKTIQGLMSDPAFVQAMDEYYENKWAHRFD